MEDKNDKKKIWYSPKYGHVGVGGGRRRRRGGPARRGGGGVVRGGMATQG
jgi:hypothetical protein